MDRGTWLGYSQWGHKELDTTEWLHSLTSLIYVCVYISPSLLRLPPTPHPTSLGNHRITEHQAGLKQVSYINAYVLNLEK